jgi:cytochrome b involved in lipid metabolism
MKSKYVLGAVFIVAVLVLGTAVFQEQGTASYSHSSQTNQHTGSSATSTAYTSAEVATHNSSTSCWSIINGKVYDLTDWIYQHPGGPDHILSICGSDGSAAFNAQHGVDSRVEQTLQQFYIGTLAS